MGNQIYKKKQFAVFPVSRGYVVVNTQKVFEEGHTHISNIDLCRRLIFCSIHKKVPKECSQYILTSLIRLTEDEVFKKKLTNLIQVRKSKGKKLKCVKQGGRNYGNR